MKVIIEESAVPLPGLEIHSPIELPNGTSICDLLRQGGNADGELYLLPSVNGKITNLDRILRDGDRLQLFRLSAGG